MTHAPLAALVAVLSVACLAGCAGPSQERRDEANAATERVNAIVADVAALAPRIDAACHEAVKTPVCVEVRDLWRGAQKAVRDAHKAIDIYDATGAPIEGMLAAIDALGDAVHRLRGLVETLP